MHSKWNDQHQDGAKVVAKIFQQTSKEIFHNNNGRYKVKNFNENENEYITRSNKSRKTLAIYPSIQSTKVIRSHTFDFNKECLLAIK